MSDNKYSINHLSLAELIKEDPSLTQFNSDFSALNSGKDENDYQVYAGSDESGKGDFFGPLVVASAVIDKEGAAKMKELGVTDSKKLSDAKILHLEPHVKEIALAYKVLNMRPHLYNRRYSELAAVGGTLNTMLTNGHYVAIKYCIDNSSKPVEFAVIDQFTTSDEILFKLEKDYPTIKFQQFHHAESFNIAVAAASILARAEFVHTMEYLSSTIGKPIPKGGSQRVTDFAKELLTELGEDKLTMYVKKHFVNYARMFE